MVRLAGVDWESFADAEGVSCVLFFSGCLHNCKGCHSPQTHSFNYGMEIDDNVIDHINEEIDKRPFLSALVLSGGDPMYSAKEILKLLPKIHIPHNTIWCYSGFTIDQIKKDKSMSKLLNKCSFLVDGEFQLENRDVSLKFRGSSNQNIWKKEKNGWIKITE